MSLKVLCVVGVLICAVGVDSPEFGCDFTTTNLRRALQNVSDWQTLGLELGVPWSKLDSLKKDPSLSHNSRKAEMFQTWWDNDLDASWKRLCDALDHMDQRRLAAVIRARCVAEDNDDADTEDHGEIVCLTTMSFLYGTTVLAGTVLMTLLLVYTHMYSRYFGRVMIAAIAVIAVILWITPFDYYSIKFNSTNNTETQPGPTELTRLTPPKEIAANNLPRLPGPFVGRDSDVVNITHLLTNSKYTNITTVGVYGPPAMGKSTLAIHVGYEMTMNGIQVRYINVNDAYHLFKETSSEGSTQPHRTNNTITDYVTEVTMYGRYGEIQLPFYLPEQQSYKSYSLRGLIKWAKSLENDTLLILDNCDRLLGNESQVEFKELIKTLSTESSAMLRTIITSRQKVAVIGGFQTHHLMQLDNDSAIKLLLLESTLLCHEEAKQIAELVSNIPLALKIVATLVDESTSVEGMLQQLKKNPMELLSPDILPQSQQIIHVIQLSFESLDVAVQTCGQFLSLFPGSFSEEAAINILSMSHFASASKCLKTLTETSMIEAYHFAGQARYQFHRLIKEFFMYTMHNSSSQNMYETMAKFNTSFQVCYSYKLDYFAVWYNRDSTEETVGRFEYDSHNFGELLQMVVLHPFSIASVTQTANCLVNSGIMLEVFNKTELFRTLNGILRVILSNYELFLQELGGDSEESSLSFIHKVFFQMKEWAVTADIEQTSYFSFCQEVSQVSCLNTHVINNSLTMLYHSSTCWLDCLGSRREWTVPLLAHYYYVV